MKTLIPLILLVLSIPVHAQDDWWKMEGDKNKPAAKRDQATPRETPPAEGDLAARIKTFRNHGRFSVRYDKFRDETYVKVGPFYVGGLRFTMSAMFVKDAEPTKYMYLLFTSSGRDWTFLKNRDLYALVDGERFALGEGDRDSDVRLRGVSETLIFEIPFDVFSRISKGSQSELKIGRIELTLKDEHKEAFRDLLSLAGQ